VVGSVVYNRCWSLTSTVILGSESRAIHDHILLSQVRDSANLEGQVPVFISPQEQGGPVVPPGSGLAFRLLLRLAGLRWRYSTPPPHGNLLWSDLISERVSQSQFYVTTDGQSVSISWNKAPILGLWQIFITVKQLRGFFMWDALSVERTGLSFTIAAGLASAVIFGSESHGTHDHILLSHVRDFPFHRLLRCAGLRWRYSTPPPQRTLLLPTPWSDLVWVSCYITLGRTDRINIFPISYPWKQQFITHIRYPRKSVRRNGLVSKNPSPRKFVHRLVP
jgi:hypothetical protein